MEKKNVDLGYKQSCTVDNVDLLVTIQARVLGITALEVIEQCMDVMLGMGYSWDGIRMAMYTQSCDMEDASHLN